MTKAFAPVSKIVASLALLAVTALPAAADEPSGCENFKWPIARQQAALAAPGANLENGGVLTIGTAARVKLSPVDKVVFAHPPGRDGIASTYAAVLNLPAPSTAGVYTVSLSGGAWIDVFQDNIVLKPSEHSGVKDCQNIRKTLKFRLTPLTTVIQISNSPVPEASIVILPE
jgi:hypothetical protein